MALLRICTVAASTLGKASPFRRISIAAANFQPKEFKV
jgi:hypothetical protein